MICFSDDKKKNSIAKAAQLQANADSTTNSSQQLDPIELERRFEE